MVGLIGSSIGSGLIVARTGRYKWLTVGAIVLMGISTVLMTQLRADTPVPIVWLWMFIAGLGVGPTFAVFTLIVQNAVPFHMLGVATSNLTFFRQIGGTVALAIVGTLFATSLKEQLAPQMTIAGVPAQVVQGFTAAMNSGAFDFNQVTGTGDIGQAITAAQPRARPGRAADRAGNPRGVQPRGRLDVHRRHRRRGRRDARGGGDGGAQAPPRTRLPAAASAGDGRGPAVPAAD